MNAYFESTIFVYINVVILTGMRKQNNIYGDMKFQLNGGVYKCH